MFVVKTTLQSSPLHGVGVFAAEDIPAGTVVWRWILGFDQEWGPEAYEALPEVARSCLKQRGWPTDRGTWRMCADHSVFTNHADQPNTIVGSDEDEDVPARDIRAGEEMTCDYRAFSAWYKEHPIDF